MILQLLFFGLFLFKGGSRMSFECACVCGRGAVGRGGSGVDWIKLTYLLYVFEQTGMSK